MLTSADVNWLMACYRWYLGIQSKKDPAHVMTEVYKAMQLLNCVWHPVNNYRVLCLWYHLPNANISSSNSNVHSSYSVVSVIN